MRSLVVRYLIRWWNRILLNWSATTITLPNLNLNSPLHPLRLIKKIGSNRSMATGVFGNKILTESKLRLGLLSTFPQSQRERWFIRKMFINNTMMNWNDLYIENVFHSRLNMIYLGQFQRNSKFQIPIRSSLQYYEWDQVLGQTMRGQSNNRNKRSQCPNRCIRRENNNNRIRSILVQWAWELLEWNWV